MDGKDFTKIEQVCDALRARVESNRPFNTEELVATLLAIAETAKGLVGGVVNQPAEKPPAEPPKEPQTEQRHL